MAKRINKTKPEIVQDMQKVAAANRMRETVRSKIYPFLLELNDTIGFTKIFLQASATAVESAFTEKRNQITVADLLPRLQSVFNQKDKVNGPEFQKYLQLFELLKGETVQDFDTMVQSLPRVIDQYFTHEVDKRPSMEIDIEKILG